MTQRSKIMLLSGLSASVLCLAGSHASADSVSVRVGGGIHVDAGVHVNVDAALDLLAEVEAGLSFGVRFAQPPPPPPPPQATVVVAGCQYHCSAAVPGYYVQQEVYVEQPQPVYVRPLRPIKRWALGAYAGSVQVDGQEDGSDFGLLGRYRLSRMFSLEVELAESQMEGGGRVDRHLGGAMLVNLMPRQKLSPVLLAGAGFGQTDIGDGEFHAEQGYAELGAGLEYRLSSSFRLTADVRAGARQSSEDVAYKSSVPVADFQQEERFARARIGGLFFF